MLDKAEIRKEIARLEYEESSYPNYAKLANLYVIRDKMQGGDRNEETRYTGFYSGAPASAPVQSAVGEYGDSDFLLAIAGKDPGKAWAVIDELMDTLAVVNARAYNTIMQRLKRL